jgi:transcriptional regulator with XRE-family HTH domain
MLYPIRYKMTPIGRVAMQIKALREKRGLSQQALADKAGLSRTYLARLETARQDPTLSTLEKLAKALKVKLPELVK